MHTSIRIKFVLVYVILVVSLLGLLNTYGKKRITSSMREETETHLYEEANQIAQEYVNDIHALNSTMSGSISSLRTQLSSLQIIDNTRYWIVDPKGEILVDSDLDHNKEGENLNHYDNTFLSKTSYTGNALAKLTTAEIVSIIYPLTSNLETTGYIILFTSKKTLEDHATIYLDAALICYFIFMGLVLLIMLYLVYQISKPVNVVTKAVKEYADGNLDYQIQRIPGRDYHELVAAIEYLASKMKNINDYQKKFIANVSHDFRSPLTSIKGYAEALSDGTIPPEFQGKYLDIILFETQRLTKLTSSLLELSQFEYNKIHLDIVTFDINQAIKMTSASFEQRCKKKNLSINLVFSQKVSLVDADINKIEQVIQNLIDNAIKFSNHDSSIDVQTVERGSKIFISVRDHGIGIPKSSLTKIWDRFYKTDLSRGKDKTGTGLGLSITKEILEAHNENIDVISTEGVGTEFLFSLKSHMTE